jgi:hypothetical protein
VSVEMNLFFNAPGDLDEVMAALGSVLSIELQRVEDDETLAMNTAGSESN